MDKHNIYIFIYIILYYIYRLGNGYPVRIGKYYAIHKHNNLKTKKKFTNKRTGVQKYKVPIVRADQRARAINLLYVYMIRLLFCISLNK